MLVIGWDVSTSIIGACAMDIDTGETLGYKALKIVGDTMMEKYHSGASQVSEFIGRLGGEMAHIVEDRLGNFTKGATMQQTLMKLAQMNAVMSYHLDSFGKVIHVHPSSAKRIAGLKVPKGGDKKLAAIELARSSDIRFPYTLTKAGNPAAGVPDMADAWLLAVAGRKILRGEATLGKGKEASGDNGPPGEADP